MRQKAVTAWKFALLVLCILACLAWVTHPVLHADDHEECQLCIATQKVELPKASSSSLPIPDVPFHVLPLAAEMVVVLEPSNGELYLPRGPQEFSSGENRYRKTLMKQLSALRGFTLIELLIVVAIIAILAAIAVPNFLEAQTRAKVSRAKADMRTLAVAMESYHVDANRYPIPADHDGEAFAGIPAGLTDEWFETRVPVSITTPIAYITSRLSEPFPGQESIEDAQFHYGTRWYWENQPGAVQPPNLEAFPVYVAFLGASIHSTQFFLLSHGPDRSHQGPDEPEGPALYDPTNGTISRGDILYFGPGTGFRN